MSNRRLQAWPRFSVVVVVLSTLAGPAVAADSCANRFTINGLKAGYSAANFAGAKTVETTAEKSGSGDTVVILRSKEMIEGVNRYALALSIPGSKLKVGTVPFQDDNTVEGLESGAVGQLQYSIGATNGYSVGDILHTNKDYGRNKVMGQLIIESLSPLSGRFEFEAAQDGYPSLNDFHTKVTDGRFCAQ